MLRAGEDGLTLQRPGQFPQPLLHYDEDAFQLGGVNAQLTFQRNAAGNLEGALLHQGGLNLAVERLSDRAPVLARTPVSAKPEDLDACAGDYALSPLVQIRLSHNGDGLRWQLSGGAPAPLIAYAPDRYAAARGEFDLRCVREGGAAATVVVLSLAGTDVTARRVDWSLSAVGGKGKVADDKRPPSRSH